MLCNLQIKLLIYGLKSHQEIRRAKIHFLNNELTNTQSLNHELANICSLNCELVIVFRLNYA